MAQGDPNPIQAAIDQLSPEARIGLDVSRQWATGVQVIPSDEFVILVFRDQTTVTWIGDDDKTVEREHVLVKNVASIVMPKPVADQLANILKNLLAKEAAHGVTAS